MSLNCEEKIKKHILLDKAHVYDMVEKDLVPPKCSYDRECGLWRVDTTGEVMMIGAYARKPQSKKWDVETGEDQKGE